MNDNELYHYGVPGMKWGQRKAAKQLSKLTGRDRSKITAKEADKFRGDVANLKSIKSRADRESYVNTHTKQLGGKKYAEAVLRQANKESTRAFIGKASKGTAKVAGGVVTVGTLAAGIAAVGFMAYIPLKVISDLHNIV